MSVWKRTLAAFLSVVLLAGLLPISVFAQETEDDKENVGYIVINETVKIRTDTGAVEEGSLPTGVSYSGGTLTLNNASLKSLNAFGGDGFTIQLGGSNAIALDDNTADTDAALKLDDCGDVVIQGGGSLTITSPVEGIAFERGDRSGTLKITGGAKVTAKSTGGYWLDEENKEYGHSGVSGHMDLTVTDGASLTAEGGFMGLLLMGNAAITDGGTVTANRVHLHGDDDGTPTTTTVGAGGSLNVTVRAEDEVDGTLGVLADASLVLDGGDIRIDTTAKNLDYLNGLDVQSGGNVSLEDGDLYITLRSGNGIMVQAGSAFHQSGGSVTVLQSGGEAVDPDHYSSVGLRLEQGGDAGFSGGMFTTGNTLDCGFSLNDTLTINGGDFRLMGRNAPIFVEQRGGLTVVGGQMDVRNTSTSQDYQHIALRSRGGALQFLGGTTELYGADYALVTEGDVTTLGSGMHAVDSETGREVSLETGDAGIYYYPCTRVTISSEAGGSSYAAAMELANGGPVTVGSAFTVRMALSLASSEGSVTVTLPENISLTQNSVTVSGAVQKISENKNTFTVPVGRSDIIRFTAVAHEDGEYSIAASVTDGATAHEERMALQVSAFTLSLPTQVNRTEIPVSGTAVPGRTVTFYEGEKEIGKTTADQLGNWSAEITIDDTPGVHTVHAEITGSDGAEIAESDEFQVSYAPDSAVVETLTVTNWVHGRTEIDPNIEETLVINYLEGTRSRSHYTYWPDLPTFTFEVAFADGTGTPDRVQDVTVVTTDWKGKETEISLTYSGGIWRGEHDFDGNTVPVPEKFRVEWETAGASAAEEPEEIPKVEEPEPVIEDYSDGAFVTGNESLTFKIPAGADLTLTDSSGETVSCTNNDGSVSAEWKPGELYVARLSNGTFQEYPDCDTLYILIEATGTGKSEYKYAEGVYENVNAGTLRNWTDQTFASDTSYQEGNVLVIPDAGRAVIVTGVEGDLYTYEEAGLEEIYETLDVNAVDMDADLILEGYDEEAVAEAFLQSGTFAAYRSAVETYAGEKNASMSFNGDGFSIQVGLTYGLSGSATNPVLKLSPEITLESTMTTKLPGGSEQETAVSATFSYELEQELRYQIRLENKDFQSMYLTRDQTQGVDLDISVTVGDAPDESAGAEIEAYFGEEAVQQYLQELEGGGENEPKLSLGRLRIPTNVPGLFLYAALDLEGEVTFFGELGMSGHLEWGQADGFLYTDNGMQKFSTPKEPSASAEMEFHMRASLSTALTASAGVELWKVIDTRLYAKVGPTFTIGGHGEAAFGTDVSESERLEAELLTAYSVDIEVGLRAALKISRTIAVGESLTLLSMSIPIWQYGANIMPTRFQTIEELVYVQSDSDLAELLDLTLEFQSFTAQVGDTTIYDGKQIFPEDKYSFSLYDGDIDGVSLSQDGRLTITGDKDREFRVKVTYTGSTSDYEIWKIVPLKYTKDSFVIKKEIKEGASKVAGFSVMDLTAGQSVGDFTTSPEGFVVVPAAAGHAYQVKENWCAPGYSPLRQIQDVPAIGIGEEPIVVTFSNVRNQRHQTPDATVPGLGDPSGYVYEGIESNRIAGATVSLYQADDQSGTDAKLWEAEAYKQVSVLTTDAMGQYLWMVPDGSWWQVLCEADGYEPVYSAWLPVPPVQTGVNLCLISKEPAAMDVEVDGQRLILRFTRPVQVDSLDGLTVTAGGQELIGSLIPVDAAWSTAAAGISSTYCATTFYFSPVGGLPGGETAQVRAEGVTTYAGTPGDVAAGAQIPEHGGDEDPDEPSSGGASSDSEPSYSPMMDVSDGGTVKVTPRTPGEGDRVTITADPDAGYKVGDVTVTDRDGRELDVTAGRNGTYTFVQPRGRVTIEVTFVREGAGSSFTDVPETYWAADEIAWAGENGYMNGISATSFAPGASVSRQQIWMILARLSGADPADMAEAKTWAVDNGISDGTNPGRAVTRQQLVALLYRFAKLQGLDVSVGESTNILSYPDFDRLSEYAIPAMQWACGAGIINGTADGQLAPQSTATRVQFAVMLYRFMN